MPKTNYSTHPGMVDILPGEVERWRALETIIHEEAKYFNFEDRILIFFTFYLMNIRLFKLSEIE